MARREIDRNDLALDLEVDGGIDVVDRTRSRCARAPTCSSPVRRSFASEDPLKAATALRDAALDGCR